MKLSSRQQVTRRDLARLIGSAAFALPCLELFGRDVRAQAMKTAKYAVFCYTPDGVNQAAFWPTGTVTDFQLSPILSPFSAYKDKLLVLGPQMASGTGAPVANTGLTYASRPPQHQAAITLTARIGTGCNEGNFSLNECEMTGGNRGLPYYDPQSQAVNRLDGPSIDQIIGEAVRGSSPFPSLNFGLHPIGGDVPSDIHFDKNGISQPRLATADEAWQRLFPPRSADALSAERKQVAVSNYLNERFGLLRGSLGKYDREVFDAHQASLREYEKQQALLSGASCEEPIGGIASIDEDSVRTGADTEKLCPFFMNLIATAFHCDLTKVASVTFGYPGGGNEGGLRMPWLGFTEPMHMVSHHAHNAARLEQYTKMHNWIASQIAGLMQALAVLKDSNGVPLLDQTVIYWFNRHGDGDSHSNDALPNILLGGAGGYFKMGRYLQLPATSPTQVLISIANSMGVDVPTFGELEFTATSDLTGLTT